MNLTNSTEGVGDGGGGGKPPVGVSRAGRVRRKNNFLTGFQVVEKNGEVKDKDGSSKRKSNTNRDKQPSKVIPASVDDEFREEVGEKAQEILPSSPQMDVDDGLKPSNSNHKPRKYSGKKGTPKSTAPVSVAKKMKLEENNVSSSNNSNDIDHEEDDDDLGDLEIDLPHHEFEESEMQMAEEIIDDGLLDNEDRILSPETTSENTSLMSMSKLKSQAQSTYMMEKNMNRKSGGQTGKRNYRKDKGNPRITAYMIWSKEQRVLIAKKYPSLDFSEVSRKLGELWQNVPENQKKLWKNKAVKLMKKNASESAYNIKNSSNLAYESALASMAADNNNIKIAPGATIFHTIPGSKKRKKNSAPLPPPEMNNIPNNNNQNSKKNSKSKAAKPGKSPKFRDTTGRLSPDIVTGSLEIAKGKGKKKSTSKSSPTSSTKKVSPVSSNAKSPKSKSKKESPKSKANKNSPNKVKTSKARKSNSKSPINNHLSNNINVSTIKGSPYLSLSPKKDDDKELYKVNGTEPMDVAAHFSLLGESLSIIGERLKEHEGQNVSGSLSVLLDSILCALGPILCLTQHIPELSDCIPQRTLTKTLDNIALIMPGL